MLCGAKISPSRPQGERGFRLYPLLRQKKKAYVLDVSLCADASAETTPPLLMVAPWTIGACVIRSTVYPHTYSTIAEVELSTALCKVLAKKFPRLLASESHTSNYPGVPLQNVNFVW